MNVDNDWLNIAVDGNTYRGAPTTIWSDPVTAANATAGWIAEENTVPGWPPGLPTKQILAAGAEKPSPGRRRRRDTLVPTKTASQIVMDQIGAIQKSGWVSGNPSITSYSTNTFRKLYAEVSGVELPTVAGGGSRRRGLRGSWGAD